MVFKALKSYLLISLRSRKKKTNKELTKERKEKQKKKRFSVVCLLGMGIYGQKQPLNCFDTVYAQVERQSTFDLKEF